jgi:hypothetical protein
MYDSLPSPSYSPSQDFYFELNWFPWLSPILVLRLRRQQTCSIPLGILCKRSLITSSFPKREDRLAIRKPYAFLVVLINYRLTPDGKVLAEQLYVKHKQELVFPDSLDSCFGTPNSTVTSVPSARSLVQALMPPSSFAPVSPVESTTTPSSLPDMRRTESSTQRYFIEEVVLLLDNREVKNKNERFVGLNVWYWLCLGLLSTKS